MNKNGFTLMEMMVVIAIIGTMSAIAIPNGITWINNAKIRGAVVEFKTSCKMAQMQAIKLNKNVALSITLPNKYFFFVDGNKDFKYKDTDTKLTEITLDAGVKIDSVLVSSSPSPCNTDGNIVGLVAFNSRGMCSINSNTFNTIMTEIIFSGNGKFYKAEIIPTGIIRILRSIDGIIWVK